MIRVETALILSTLLRLDRPMTNEAIAEELGLTLFNVTRKTLTMYNNHFVGTEVRYKPTTRRKRDKTFFMWITQRGVDALAAYDERRKERPTVAAKNPVARGKKAPVQRAKVANSVFNWETR